MDTLKSGQHPWLPPSYTNSINILQRRGISEQRTCSSITFLLFRGSNADNFIHNVRITDVYTFMRKDKLLECSYATSALEICKERVTVRKLEGDYGIRTKQGKV